MGASDQISAEPEWRVGRRWGEKAKTIYALNIKNIDPLLLQNPSCMYHYCMRIIEKIEIKNFRSIKHLVIDSIDESVLIFSGGNSSGKTNILRALNLFFNNEVGFGKKLQSSDLFRKKDKKPTYISIEIWFNTESSSKIRTQKKVAQRFSIIKRWNFQSGFINEDIAQNIGGVPSALSTAYSDFLYKWARFHYIPTDRKVFFKKIHSEMAEFLGSPFQYRKLKVSQSAVATAFRKLESDLGARDIQQLAIPGEIKDQLEIVSIGYSLPEMTNLLKALDFSLSKKNGEKYFISGEGDGLKFFNLLQIIKIFDARSLSEARSRPYFSILGIDEPENSLEQKNIEHIKEIILNVYSKDSQIFLASHAPEFLLEADEPGRNKWIGFFLKDGETVKQPPISTASTGQLKMQFSELERQMFIEKMGIGMTREEKMELNKEIAEINSQLTDLKKQTRPVVLTEGVTDASILNIAYEKLGGKKKFGDFVFNSSSSGEKAGNGAKNLSYFLVNALPRLDNSRKVIGIFDNDPEGFKSHSELGAFSEDVSDSELKTSVKNKNHAALLLPIPDHLKSKYVSTVKVSGKNIEHSFFEIEDYLSEDSICKQFFNKRDKYQSKYGVTISKIEDKPGFIKLVEAQKENIDWVVFEPLLLKISKFFKR